jgi:hypothetical protein
MNDLSGIALDPFQIARSEIDQWRGKCLNAFSKGEAVIGKALEGLALLSAGGHALKIEHLAGQRATQLANMLPKLSLTERQRNAISSALDDWRNREQERTFLAHGVVAAGLQRNSEWFAIFDVRVFRNGIAEQRRWAVSRAEADDFAVALKSAADKLAQSCGAIPNWLAAD